MKGPAKNRKKCFHNSDNFSIPKPPPIESVPIETDVVSFDNVKLRPYAAKPKFNFFAGHPLFNQ